MVGFLRFGIGPRRMRYVFSERVTLLDVMKVFRDDFGIFEIQILNISSDRTVWEIEVGKTEVPAIRFLPSTVRKLGLWRP